MPIALTTRQQTIIDAANKTLSWRFRVEDKNGAFYYWSTKTLAASTDSDIVTIDDGAMDGVTVYGYNQELGYAYDYKIEDFSGVSLSVDGQHAGIIRPSELSFTVLNSGDVLTPSDFVGGEVLLSQCADDGDGECVIRRFRFAIKKVNPGYHKFGIVCVDFLQQYLNGYYPNTQLINDIFPSDVVDEDDRVCVPVPFGTAYIPLRSVYKGAAVTINSAEISFVASSAGAACRIETADSSDFSELEVGRYITTSGADNGENNGTFQIDALEADIIYLSKDAGLVDEAADSSTDVTITMGSRYYLLGPSDKTYSISKIRSPRTVGKKVEFTSNDYAFNQVTIADEDSNSWKAMQAIIADVDGDGTADAPGFWFGGDQILDAPVELYRTDTLTNTQMPDLLQMVLLQYGMDQNHLNLDSFDVVKNSLNVSEIDLELEGAFWYKQDREEILSSLLVSGNSILVVEDQLYLYRLSKTSQKTLTSVTNKIYRNLSDTLNPGKGTFKRDDVADDYVSNCGYVTWQRDGEAQDKFLKLLVPAKGSVRTIISDEVLKIPFVKDSQHIQTIGTLYYQRKLMRDADISFTGSSKLWGLYPGEIITLNHARYGGEYDMVIENYKIHADGYVVVDGYKPSVELDDWEDLSPAAITVVDDDTAQAWQPTISGPLSDQDVGVSAFDTWGKEYLTVGPIENGGKFTDIQKALNQVEQAGGGAIYILNGNYQATAPWYVPDVNIEVVGQSQGGVTLKNLAGSDLWVLHNLTKKFYFHDFSIASQNVAAFSNMIKFYGDTAADNTAIVEIGNITATLIDDGSNSGDIFFYGNKGQTGRVLIDKTKTSGGKYGISIADSVYGSEVIISKSSINACLSSAIYLYCNSLQVINNQIDTDNRCVFVRSVVSGLVHGNDLSGEFVDGVVSLASSKLRIVSNDINSTRNISVNDVFEGISATSGSGAAIDGNRVTLVSSGVGQAFGIHVDTLTESTINGNPIYIDVVDTARTHLGIYLEASDRNIVSANNIDLVNNDAVDTGIYLNGTSDNNQGGDNITYNCGTGINDFPGTNFVTGLDV